VILPDRPGSLGAVASALGHVRADISAVEIVERSEGFAIDDFMLSLPPDGKPDALVSACTALDGVEVLWVSYYPESWGLEADTDILDAMTSDPSRAEEILMEGAPAAFHCLWSAVVDRRSRRIVARTALAPEPDAFEWSTLGDLAEAHVVELEADWITGWGSTLLATAPFRDSRSIVIARSGGPEFRRSEVVRLRHLASLAGHTGPGPSDEPGQYPMSVRQAK